MQYSPQTGLPGNSNPRLPSRSDSQRSVPGVVPRKVGRKRQLYALLLLDALRGARTYVQNYTVGRGAE